MKLTVGNVILVHGWIMMKGLEGGEKYRVTRISERFGKPVYWFSKPKGKKEIVGHYADDVDWMMNLLNNNRIEILVSIKS